ncbi:MAG: sulfotransferase [Mariniblastus sp.]|nr:sulfotransferase [Mariniblastus sp.]
MIKDFHLYNIADADSATSPRGVLRTARRAFKRCLLDRQTIEQPRFFCQNVGACGSTYLIQLLRENGIERVFHEKAPDLERLGVERFFNQASSQRLIRLLRYTRHNVFLEANNRLFAMTRELKLAFPAARFIHLYRDPAEAVRSAMSKPNVVPYLKSNLRLRTSISGPISATPFEKFCHNWKTTNQRIFDDLESVRRRTGEKCLTLKFDDLIGGRLDSLEHFCGIKLSMRARPPVNQRVDRPEGKFPPPDQWTLNQKSMLRQICYPLLSRLDAKALSSKAS